MMAIVTKFIGPTNYRGARVRAKCEAGSVIVSWDHAVGVVENHRLAAMALASKKEWGGKWVGGNSPDGRGYVFVNVKGSGGAEFTVG